jgi:hypothetical protein
VGKVVGVGVLVLALLSPLGWLALLLVMERVERPLRQESVSDQLAAFLDAAGPDDIEAFISQGLAPALDRYWKRRRLARLLPRLTRS